MKKWSELKKSLTELGFEDATAEAQANSQLERGLVEDDRATATSFDLGKFQGLVKSLKDATAMEAATPDFWQQKPADDVEKTTPEALQKSLNTLTGRVEKIAGGTEQVSAMLMKSMEGLAGLVDGLATAVASLDTKIATLGERPATQDGPTPKSAAALAKSQQAAQAAPATKPADDPRNTPEKPGLNAGMIFDAIDAERRELKKSANPDGARLQELRFAEAALSSGVSFESLIETHGLNIPATKEA